VDRYSEDAEPDTVLKANLGDAINRLDDVRVVDLAEPAQAGRQVVRANQDSVDALYANDRLDISHRVDMLGLHDHRCALVGIGDVLAQLKPVTMCAPDTDAARAGWGILG